MLAVVNAAVEKAAKLGDAKAVSLPRPLKGADEPHFSFAGLKSAVLRAHEAGTHKPEDIAASFQQAVVDCLEDRLEYSLSRIDPLGALVVAGGVAANDAIRAMLQRVAEDMAETAKVEAYPRLEGRQMLMVLAPK